MTQSKVIRHINVGMKIWRTFQMFSIVSLQYANILVIMFHKTESMIKAL